MAKLAGMELSKAALSHAVVPRPRHDSPLLPNGAVVALSEIPEDYTSSSAEDTSAEGGSSEQGDGGSNAEQGDGEQSGSGGEAELEQQSGDGHDNGGEAAAGESNMKDGSIEVAVSAAETSGSDMGDGTEEAAAADGETVKAATAAAESEDEEELGTTTPAPRLNVTEVIYRHQDAYFGNFPEGCISETLRQLPRRRQPHLICNFQPQQNL